MEVLTETVKVIVEKIVGYTITAVGRQMGYLIRYKKNVDNLKNKVGDLEDDRKSVERKVEAARNNVEEIEDKVLTWLKRVETVTEEAQEFFKEEGQAKLKCFNGRCLNLKARYQLGKRAHKMGLAVKELKDTADTFDTVGHRVPMRGGTTISTKGYEDFESRKSTLNGIMRALKDDSIRAIGVYGMGGVGKTMLVGKIATQAKEDDLFERIVKVVVSQTPDLEKIQKDIAEELGLSFQDHETDSQKADLLRKRLKKGKILLIIDDIWDKIDLESRGISFGDDQKGSKLLLTSRSEDVLGEYTDPQGIFQVEALSTNEAEFLFVKIVGNFAETSDFQSTMVEVVKECAGLPIAITTVANALKSRKDPKVWKDAVGQLKRANPTQIKDMLKEVYSSIKLSYDFLTKEAQSLFLFCSIFEEDKVIRIDLLWRYLVGLDFFEGVYKMEEVRNRVHTLVNSLKDSCLLLEGDRSGTFKMHDVIRDVAIYIADKEEKMLTIRSLEGPETWLNMKKWEGSFGIALFDVDFEELLERFGCPQLKFIFLSNERICLQPIPNNFFEGMKELRVLVLINASLPHLSSISYLHNLQSLFLVECELEDVALIGELKNLRALTLSHSYIKQLPMEIRQLTRLQLLNLNSCTKLEVIPSNVFSDLRGLEELYMNRSFNQWHIDGEITERNNTRVSELDHLPLLTTLYIHITNPKVLPKVLLFKKLERYKIIIGDYENWDWHSDIDRVDDEFEISRTLKLQLDRALQIDDGIKVLLKSCEYLDLTPREGIKNILYEVDKEGFPHLKHFYVRNNNEIQYIVNLMEFQCVAFPALQSLSLDNMKNLEEICHDQVPMGSFRSLKKLVVSKCEKLTSVFSLTMFGCFSQLQEITIVDCKVMRAIFSKERKHEIQVNHDIRSDIIDFTQLRSFYLRNLPNLVGFHPDADSQLLFNEKVAFSNLEEIHILGINNLKMLWHNHQLVPDSFCKIKELHVNGCKNLMNIFPPNMLRRRQNREELTIEDCNLVEEVFGVRGENVDEICDKGSTQLRQLTLYNLPKLKHVWTSDLEAILTFQNLREVEVSHCKTLKSLFPISVAKSLEQLESLHIDDCELMEEIVALKEGLETTTEFVFPRITSLSLKLLPELKCLYPGKHTSEWPSLEELTICKCNKVRIVASNEFSFPNTDGLGHRVPVQQPLLCVEKHVWTSDPEAILTFQNLRKVKVSKCKTLKSLFPISVAKSLEQLRSLYIDDCELMEEIVALEEGLETTTEFVFPRITSLSLELLPELKYFYPGKHTSKWPSLKELTIWKCNKMRIVASNELSFPNTNGFGHRAPVQHPLFCVEKHVWTSDPEAILTFQNLRKVEVYKCKTLKSLFPISVAKSLEQLRRLDIDDCELMEEIVALEEGLETTTEFVFPRTTSLSLKLLPELKCFYPGKHTSKWPLLKELTICKCNKVRIVASNELSFPNTNGLGHRVPVQQPLFCVEKHVWTSDPEAILTFQNLREVKVSNCKTLKSLFPISVAKSIEQLRSLHIDDCELMEEIVALEEGLETTIEFVFPRITSLSLKLLPELKCFYPGKHTSKWPVLKELTICKCNKVRIVASNELSFPNTNGLGHRVPVQQPLFCVEKHVWTSDPEAILTFQNLREVKVSNCKTLKSLFPISVAKSIEQLRSLHIDDCELMEEIVALEEGLETTIEFVFPRITFLSLNLLPELKCLYPGKHTSKWPVLKELTICKCNKVRIVASNELSFPNTNGLGHRVPVQQPLFCVEKHIWTSDPEAILTFQNLRKVKVSKCKTLKSLFPISVAKSLEQLRSLHIDDCELMEEIVALEEGLETTTEFVFTRITFLSLKLLPELKCFYPGKHTSRWPVLKELTICKCNKVRIVASNELSFPNTNGLGHRVPVQQPLFCVEKHVWTSDPEAILTFQNLRKVKVYKCKTLKSLFPISVAKSLEQLRRLHIDDCELMEEIVALEEGLETTTEFVFPRITSLSLKLLPELKCFYPGKHTSEWPLLKELTICKCNKVRIVASNELRFPNIDGLGHRVPVQQPLFCVEKHVWTSDPEAIITFQNLRQVKVSQCKTLKSLFPISVAKSLEQLESLHIKDCGLMEEIVALEEGLETTTEFVFPRITSLSLKLLPKLKYFYPGKHTSKWPSLKILKICKCNKVRIVALNELSFPNTDGLGHCVPVQQPLFLIQKDTFPNLNELNLDWNETINQTNGQLFGEFFCKLEVLRLYGKDDKLIAVPSVLVEGLRYLKSLSVTNLFFDNEGQYAGTFERLTELNLSKMPKLMLLWKENSEQGRALQNLEILDVSECGRLKNLVPSSMHFRNLNVLRVWKYHGLISLATSSTVKSLVQLKELFISGCKRMREIVTNEGEGEAGDEICFNQLNSLWLGDLPSLRSFHLGNRTIKFPSLEDLRVIGCPEMKIFSNGVLSMPKLTEVVLDENEWWAEQSELLPEEDVNSAIKRFWEENYDPCVQQLFTEKENGVDDSEDDSEDDSVDVSEDVSEDDSVDDSEDVSEDD